jgi:hypothetical protein
MPADTITAEEATAQRTRRKRRHPWLVPILLRAKEAAAFLAISVSALHRADAGDLIHAGPHLGGAKVRRRRELAARVEAGMPDRDGWEAIRETRNRRLKVV